MMTDPIADMLTRIRNAVAVTKPEIVLPYSKIKFEISKILKKENFIEACEVIEEQPKKKEIKIALRYNDKQPAISHIKRVSKPGRRIYANREHLPYVLSDFGVAVISTSRGLMTNKQARRAKIGGEIICEIW